MHISVVLPVYNGAGYVIEQMDSLKRQSMPADEVIIIDDGSTDNTVDIVDKYILDNSLTAWRMIRNEKNLGWRKTFWKVIKLAEGDVIFICDQDDIWHKDKIDHMMRLMEEHDEINVLKCDNITFSGDQGKYLSMALEDIELDISKLKQDKLYRHSFNTRTYTGCTMCVRRSFVAKIEPYWKEDFPYDSYIYRMSILTGSMYLYEIPLVFQRVHENNATKRGADANNSDYQRKDAVLKEAESLALRDYAFNCGTGIRLAEHNYRWSRLRKSFYQSKNILYAVKLIRYLNYYPGYRTYFMDLKYIYGSSD